jgi:hypothetical protein
MRIVLEVLAQTSRGPNVSSRCCAADVCAHKQRICLHGIVGIGALHARCPSDNLFAENSSVAAPARRAAECRRQLSMTEKSMKALVYD